MAKNWTTRELRVAVEQYLAMLERYRMGEAFVKSHIYEEIANEIGRSPKSVEYRMQNISYVLHAMGREWLPGLRPASHVGARVARQIEEILAELEEVEPSHAATLEFEIQAARERVKKGLIPKGKERPAKKSTQTTQYSRDPEVIAWVLENAHGKCECCGESAPFMKPDGEPYLEVHHVWRLADGGPDTIENAVALCPNCHRAMHYAADAEERAEQLRKRIPRLATSNNRQ